MQQEGKAATDYFRYSSFEAASAVIHSICSAWSPTHGFTGVAPFIRDSLPAMPGVRRGRRAPQPVLKDAEHL
jgi:hypothetical protein